MQADSKFTLGRSFPHHDSPLEMLVEFLLQGADARLIQIVPPCGWHPTLVYFTLKQLSEKSRVHVLPITDLSEHEIRQALEGKQ